VDAKTKDETTDRRQDATFDVLCVEIERRRDVCSVRCFEIFRPGVYE